MQVRKSFLFLAQASTRASVAFLMSLQGRAAGCGLLLLLAAVAPVAVPGKVFAQGRESMPAGDAGRPSLGGKIEVRLQPDQARTTQARTTPIPTQPASTRREGTLSRFGLAFKTSTLGLGGDLGVRLVRPINLRVGFSTFHFSADLNHDGIPFTASLRLRSLQTIVDWFPFAGSYHLSPGLIFNNHNHIAATATLTPGQVQTSGNIKYISDPNNPIVGNALSAFGKIAPMLLAGFGNLLPRYHHFAYSVDLGVVYQGHPKSNFTLQGSACDPSGVVCVNIANDIDVRKQVAAAQRDLDKSVSTFMRFYPVVSVEFGYRF